MTGRGGVVEEGSVGTPVESVGTALARRVDGCATVSMFDDIERLLPQLFKLIVDNSIEAPATFNFRLGHAGREFRELARSGLKVAAAITPKAVVIGKIAGQVG